MKTLRRHWDLVLCVVVAAILSAFAPMIAVHFLSKTPAGATSGKPSHAESPRDPQKSDEAEAPKLADGDGK